MFEMIVIMKSMHSFMQVSSWMKFVHLLGKSMIMVELNKSMQLIHFWHGPSNIGPQYTHSGSYTLHRWSGSAREDSVIMGMGNTTINIIWWHCQTFVIYAIGVSPWRTKVVVITFTHTLCIAIGIAPTYFIASLVTVWTSAQEHFSYATTDYLNNSTFHEVLITHSLLCYTPLLITTQLPQPGSGNPLHKSTRTLACTTKRGVALKYVESWFDLWPPFGRLYIKNEHLYSPFCWRFLLVSPSS